MLQIPKGNDLAVTAQGRIATLDRARIQEPGLFAFYYPNNDVLNGGRPTPAARMDAMAGLGPFSGSYAYAATDSTANGASCAQRYRSYEPASGTFLGYGGRRHKCG
jgi:BA14K-like protein